MGETPTSLITTAGIQGIVHNSSTTKFKDLDIPTSNIEALMGTISLNVIKYLTYDVLNKGQHEAHVPLDKSSSLMFIDPAIHALHHIPLSLNKDAGDFFALVCFDVSWLVIGPVQRHLHMFARSSKLWVTWVKLVTKERQRQPG